MRFPPEPFGSGARFSGSGKAGLPIGFVAHRPAWRRSAETAIMMDGLQKRRPGQSGPEEALEMNEADALDIVQIAIWTVLVAAGPAVFVAMFVGVGIAFVQALTQVQEMTLTFVPKIVAVLITVAVSAPFVGAQISTFTNIVFQRIETGF
jgi:flagellar biosynthetic protein FliQ